MNYSQGLHLTQLKCFKAYDVRGQVGTELNTAIVYDIARAYAEFLKPEKVVIGADVRLTSHELKESTIAGLIDSGVNVIDIGVSGTEEVAFATNYFAADGGIEITASHNPIDYNGLKMVRKGARPISIDTGLREIKKIAEQRKFIEPKAKGTVSHQSSLEAYADHIINYIDGRRFQKPLRILVNSGNGAAGHAVDMIENRIIDKNIPIELVKFHHEEDGNFPNGVPNPMLEENRADTAQAVIESQADMGIAFDGDFDRCFFFDEKGNYISSDYIVSLLAEAFLIKNPNERVVYEPRVIWNTVDTVTRCGGEPVLSKSGHSFMKETMHKYDAIYGGETSAHHYFRDFAYCDSGMIPWLLVSELVSNRGEPLSRLVKDRMTLFPSSGEINCSVIDADTTISNILAIYKDYAKSINYIDGISIEFEAWRFNLRASNTEPVIRLNVETRRNPTFLKAKTLEVLTHIREN